MNKFKAKVKYNDSLEVFDVIVSTSKVRLENDEEIFYYFLDEEDIKRCMKPDQEDFQVLEYEPFERLNNASKYAKWVLRKLHNPQAEIEWLFEQLPQETKDSLMDIIDEDDSIY